MQLLKEIRACRLCEDVLPHAPKPILQFSTSSRLLLVGQAPGIKAHDSNRPWNDASGERLRDWLQIEKDLFYNPQFMAIVPMGFCYPGRGASGDNPPRPECQVRWMDTILCHLKKVEIKILVGSYACNYFLGNGSVTDKIKMHSSADSEFIVLPHPSPRNNIWLSKNLWYEREVLPCIREKLHRKLKYIFQATLPAVESPSRPPQKKPAPALRDLRGKQITQ